jgi:hypothetical protein
LLNRGHIGPRGACQRFNIAPHLPGINHTGRFTSIPGI